MPLCRLPAGRASRRLRPGAFSLRTVRKKPRPHFIGTTVALLPPGKIDIESQTWRRGLLPGPFGGQETPPDRVCAFKNIPSLRTTIRSIRLIEEARVYFSFRGH